MVLDLTRYIVVDNHAHSLLRGHLQFDEIAFRRAFSETNSLSILQDHLPTSVAYMDMINRLCRFFEVANEGALLEYRFSQKDSEYIRELWDDISIAGLIVDDGYRRDESITLRQLAELSGRPVYRCVRIEPVLEDAIKASSTFSELSGKFEEALVDDQSGSRVVSWKSICAYRGGLDIRPVSEADAKNDFDRVKRQFSEGNPRIEACPLYHWFLLRAFDWAGLRGLPVQLHTGIGDDDADLRSSNPLYLRALLKAKRFARTRFVFLHCFPFVREAAFLCSLYPNVFMDLSLSLSLASPLSEQMYIDALAVAPTTKILGGTDGHSVPESHWYGAYVSKLSLEKALNGLLSEGFLSERQASDVAARILHANAMGLYGLEDLV